MTTVRFHRIDRFLIPVLAVLGAGASFVGSGLPDRRLHEANAWDVWFEADAPRVFGNMTTRSWTNVRSKVHPVFTLVAYGPVYVLRRGLGLSPDTAVRLVIALVAGLWVAAWFGVFRFMGLPPPDAVLFTVFGAGSAAAMFWFIVPETYPFASLSILVVFLLVVGRRERPSEALTTAASAFSLGMVVTNWMYGLGAALARHPWRRAVQVSVNAFAIVVLLWAVQKKFFPSSEFFLGNRMETAAIFSAESLGPVAVIRSFVYHTVVLPAIAVVQRPGAGEWPIMITQPALPGSGTAWGLLAVGTWTALLGLGGYAMITLRRLTAFRRLLGATIAGQLILHVVFGNETFLYSLNFLPPLLAMVALVSLTPLRKWGLGLAAVALLSTGINNTVQMGKAIDFFAEHTELRHDAAAEQARRPDDPWPMLRGRHGLTPADNVLDAASHWAGGSFVPGYSTFGVTVWLRDADGTLVPADRLPAETLIERTVRRTGAPVPDIVTEAGVFRSRWWWAGDRRWTLDLDIPGDTGTQVYLAVRSVPVGRSPVRALTWLNPVLEINHRWSATVTGGEVTVRVGDERTAGWFDAATGPTSWSGDDGWGYAILGPFASGHWAVQLRDQRPGASRDRFLHWLD